MKTIALVALNARFTHSNPALYSLRSFASDRGCDIRIHSFTINTDENKILNTIISQEPDCIGFSVYIWNSEIIKRLIPLIKKALPDTVITAGGPEVSYNADKWIKDLPALSHIIKGPGEAGFKYLLDKDLICTEKIISIKNPPFSQIPFAYSKDDLKSLNNRYIYYESSRGCPFRCSYCLSSRLDQKLEFRKTETVKQELDQIIASSPRLVKFVDRTFNSGKSHYREIWKHLISKHSLSGTIFHFEIYPSLLDDEDLELLRKCPKGLFQFEIGIQSTCAQALKAINRQDSWDLTSAVTKKLVQAGNIHIHTDLIAGLPFEDMKTLEKSFNDIYRLRAGHFQAGLLKILPGTVMSEKTREYGIKYEDIPPYGITENRWLSKQEIDKFKIVSRLLDLFHNSETFDLTLINIEELFCTPFDLYSSVAEFIEQNNLSIKFKEWENSAEIILAFIESALPDHSPFFRDCLRWDHATTSRNHRFPEILSSPEMKQAKKKGFSHIISFSVHGKIKFAGREFSRHDLKKSLFFRAETQKFRKEYMNGMEMALFLPDKKILLYNPE